MPIWIRSSQVSPAAGSMICPPRRVSKTNGSTHRSSFSRPRTNPATIAMTRPAPTYSRVGPIPNIPNSRPIATSLTRGLAIRKLSVTPRGTPAATNPMNAGTALHEQNGVTTPSPAAMTLPTPSRLPPSSARVRSTLMNERSTVTAKMIPTSKRAILIESSKKKCTPEPRRLAGARPMTSYTSQSQSGPLTSYRANQPSAAAPSPTHRRVGVVGRSRSATLMPSRPPVRQEGPPASARPRREPTRSRPTGRAGSW